MFKGGGRGAAVPGRRRGTAAVSNGQGGGEAAQSWWTVWSGKEWRRCQGGGEAPPQYQTPREEERVPNLGGPCGPESVAAVPGRRRGTAAVSNGQGGGEAAQSWWTAWSGICGGGAREEERHRRSIRHPGRRRGCPIQIGRLARCKDAAIPGRRLVSPLIAKAPGRRRGASRKLTCRRQLPERCR